MLRRTQSFVSSDCSCGDCLSRLGALAGWNGMIAGVWAEEQAALMPLVSTPTMA